MGVCVSACVCVYVCMCVCVYVCGGVRVRVLLLSFPKSCEAPKLSGLVKFNDFTIANYGKNKYQERPRKNLSKLILIQLFKIM